jgi:hypothetical protein
MSVCSRFKNANTTCKASLGRSSGCRLARLPVCGEPIPPPTRRGAKASPGATVGLRFITNLPLDTCHAYLIVGPGSTRRRFTAVCGCGSQLGRGRRTAILAPSSKFRNVGLKAGQRNLLRRRRPLMPSGGRPRVVLRCGNDLTVNRVVRAVNAAAIVKPGPHRYALHALIGRSVST